MISLEKSYILTPLQKLPKNVGDLGKLIVAKGFKKLPNVQNIAQSGHTDWDFYVWLGANTLIKGCTVRNRAWRGSHRDTVDSSAPCNLLPWVQNPSTPSMLLAN